MDDLPDDWIHKLLNSPDHSLQDVDDELDFNLPPPEIYHSSLEMEITPTETRHITAEHHQQLIITNCLNSENAAAPPPNSSSPPFSPYVNPFGVSDSSSTHLQQQQQHNSSGKSNNEEDHEMVVAPENVNYSLSSSSRPSNENMSALESSKATKSVQARRREPGEARNHVVAERKRRERLNQKLISLASLIPGLKKMDKASIIGDATKYLKQLQERVQTLDKKAKKKIVEPTTVPSSSNGFGVTTDEYYSSSADEYFDDYFKQPFPEIVVRVSDKNMLLRIHCEKQDGVTAKILNEIQKLHLKVISCSAVSFGNAALDITITAKIGDEFHIKRKDLLKILKAAVLKDDATHAIKLCRKVNGLTCRGSAAVA